ncbi:hypothetical protein QOZ80_5AG0406880 [Eleusine coracana subsp. coracana]|nr:hypothetical protein QOZ80_5AG0406880 [Eleusine coracana subsp. coracana]
MVPPLVIEEEEEEGMEVQAKAPKNASLAAAEEAEDKSTVRRPGRLRVVHPDVAEFLRSPRVWHPRRPTPPSSPRAAAAAGDEDDNEEVVRYDCAFEEEDGKEEGLFAPPRLVWGKVKNHPWWPGQVFDPADASELAQKQTRRRGSHLVAYFWDKSFAWADAAALRPLRAGSFARFAAQSALSPFAAAVDAALAEVARRVDAGLSCACNAAVFKNQQVVDNAGVRDGAYGAAVDASFARRAFRGEAFGGYLAALAAAPMAGANGVDLAVATAQLKAFSRWRGSRGLLPEYNYFDGIDGVATKPASAKKRRSRSRKSGSDAASGGGTRKMARCRNADDDDGAMDLEDLQAFPEPTSTPQTFTTTKMGILMNRAAKEMSRSPVVLKANGNSNVSAAPKVVAHMARCTGLELPPAVNNGVNTTALKDDDDHACRVDEQQTGLVLNFSRPSAVPSKVDLTTIFSKFGPIKEVTAENASATVIFKRRAHAEEAFVRTSKIRAISASLISFRLTYSLPPAIADPPVEEQQGRGSSRTLDLLFSI